MHNRNQRNPGRGYLRPWKVVFFLKEAKSSSDISLLYTSASILHHSIHRRSTWPFTYTHTHSLTSTYSKLQLCTETEQAASPVIGQLCSMTSSLQYILPPPMSALWHIFNTSWSASAPQHLSAPKQHFAIIFCSKRSTECCRTRNWWNDEHRDSTAI